MAICKAEDDRRRTC